MGDRLGTAGVVGFFFPFSIFFFPSHARLLPTFYSYIPFYLRFSMHISFFSFAYTFFNIYSFKIVIVAWKISQTFYSFSRLTQKGEFSASKQHKDYCWNTPRAYDHTTLNTTGSRLITKVKQCRACSVLGWVTAWEQQVL